MRFFQHKLPWLKWWHVPLALFGAMLFGGGAGLHLLFTAPRWYESQARLVFPLPSGTSRLGAAQAAILGSSIVPSESDFPLVTYDAVLRSRRAAEALAKRLNVRDLYQLDNDREAAERVQMSLSTTVDENRTLLVTATAWGTPSCLAPSDLANRSAANARDDKFREFASQLAAAAIDEMAAIADEIKLDRSKSRLAGLQRQLADEQAELSLLERELRTAQQRLGAVDVSSYSGMLASSLLSARQKLRETEEQLAGLEQQRTTLRGQLREQARQVDQLPAEFPFLGEARTRERAARAELSRVEQMYGPENAEVLKARRELERANAELERELASARSGMNEELLSVETRLTSLQASRREAQQTVQRLQRELSGLPVSAAQDLELLARAVDAQYEVVRQLSAQVMQADMDYQQRGVQWHVLDEPLPPLYKSGPGLLRRVMIGFIGGFLLFSLPLATAWLGQLFEVHDAEEQPPVALPSAPPSTAPEPDPTVVASGDPTETETEAEAET